MERRRDGKKGEKEGRGEMEGGGRERRGVGEREEGELKVHN